MAQTATFGIVSGLGRSGLGVDEYEDYIQTDAVINPGSSGGALVTPSGALIGITRGVPATSEASAGIGFAIPSQIAEQIVRQMIAHGEYRRGWLGLSVTSAETDDGGGAGEAQGVVVNELTCNSAAELQGVQLGDVIMALDGRALGTDGLQERYKPASGQRSHQPRYPPRRKAAKAEFGAF
ncbi:PDZ domain-containing protein [Pararhizobium sp. LjRoot235]|uniref:S1C family serine protease n=1 Tax=Pararhizobium sp. LjRoot235 TaxID=3342291 RepID=UPI003ECF4B39